MVLSCCLRSFQIAGSPHVLTQAVTPGVLWHMETPPQTGLGRHKEPAMKFSHFFMELAPHGVVRPGFPDHSLALTLIRRRDQRWVPSLRRGYGPRPHRYYGPSGLPPGTGPFRLRLIGSASAQRG